MCRRGACRNGGEVGTTEAVFDGDDTAWHIDNHLGNEEGVEARRAVAFGKELLHLVEEMGNTANARSEHDADVVEVGVFRGDARVGNGFVGSHDVELGKQVVFAHGLLVEEVVRVVALYLAGEMRLV